MGKIFCIIGKSSSGKDTIYQKLVKDFPLSPITLSTTRPMREEEKEGREYFFINEKTRIELHQNQEVIEERVFHTVYGDWYYLTTNKNIDLETKNYITINTLAGFNSLKTFYGKDVVIPIYIYVSLNSRLDRAFDRDDNKEGININQCKEICRRFIRDEEDFSEANIIDAEIPEDRQYENENLQECYQKIIETIKKELKEEQKKKQKSY